MKCENELVNEIVKVLDNKKAMDIQVLKINELTTIADYFVIATGGSNTQVQALSDNIEEELLKKGIKHTGIEGYNSANWILLGYDDVIVHIFQREPREFYKLEHLWQDAEKIDISEIINNN